MFRSAVAGLIHKPSLGAAVVPRRKHFYFDELDGWKNKQGSHTLAGLYDTLSDLQPRYPNVGSPPTSPTVNFDNGNYFFNATPGAPGLDSLIVQGDGTVQFDQSQGNTPSLSQNCMPALKFTDAPTDVAIEFEIRINPVALNFKLILGGRASNQSGGWTNGQNFIGAEFDVDFDGRLFVLIVQATTAGFVSETVYADEAIYTWPQEFRFRLELVGQTRIIKVNGRQVYSGSFTGYASGNAWIAPLFYQTSGTLNQNKILSMAVENVFADLLDTSIALTDAQTQAFASNVLETIALTDAQEHNKGYNVTETIALTDALSAPLAALNIVTETVGVSSSTALAIGQNVTETIALTDARSQGVESNVTETIALTDAQQIYSALTSLVVEAIALTDAQAVGPTQLVVETIAVVSATSNSTEFTNNVTETIALTDAQTKTALATTNVTETVALTDAQTQVLQAINIVVESLFVANETKGGGSGAWSANLESFAMSRYTNYPFQSMAVVDGVPVGVNEEGIFRLDQEDDAGADIEAGLVFDWSDRVAGREGLVPTPNFKHTKAMYVDGTADGQLAVAIGHSVNGTETESTYTFTPITAGAYATSRVLLGRGIRSRYLRPSISNVAGSDFTINDAKLDVDLSRRTI